MKDILDNPHYAKPTYYRGASWGPLQLQREKDRIQAWTPNSRVAVIEAPVAFESPRSETLELLRDGLPVMIEGMVAAVLTQPQRKYLRRRDRVIHVSGDPSVVPPGTILRARWFHSVGLETIVDGERTRLIRPRCDALDAPGLNSRLVRRPKVDSRVSPDLLAIWGAARWHLLGALHT
jgi:hypothetical protein